VTRVDVETAREMLDAVEASLPADVAILVAAVADWRAADQASQKIKKDGNAPAPLLLEENPDILATLSQHKNRPGLLIGFAAETENVLDHASSKRTRKGADWIVANDVSGDVMGGATNEVHLITQAGSEDWPEMTKSAVATRLIERIADALAGR
jgi:phosphopantothenoylcysteine decarboxylase/phosphopantothenate--cysteine ligase